MKYIVAVSGGVDSVVLLDMMVHARSDDSKDIIGTYRASKSSWHSKEFEASRSESLEAPVTIINDLLARQVSPADIIVAHFDHGIRGEESTNDSEFVKRLSQMYGLKYEIGHGNLTQNASEALAREKRYEFLQSVAVREGGQLVTAHHRDDLIETIALNLERGTGWRGLAVFDTSLVLRPLLYTTKAELYDYALSRQLEWVEDATNSDERYQRNRLRKKLARLDADSKDQLVALRDQQVQLKQHIEQEAEKFDAEISRYFFTMLPESVALELLKRQTSYQLLSEQLQRLLLAIKTAKPGTTMQPGGGLTVEFSTRSFSIKNTSELL